MAGFLGAGDGMPDMIKNFGIGPASGYVAGQQMNTGMDMLGRSSQSQEMALAQQAQDLDQSRRDVELKDLKRKLGIEETKTDLEQQPLAASVKKSEKETKLSNDDETKQMNKHKAMLRAAEDADGFTRMLKEDQGGPGDGSPPPYIYTQLKQQWKKMGHPDLPDDPVEGYQQLSKMSGWYNQVGPRLKEQIAQKDAMDMQRLKGDQALDVANVKGDWNLDAAKARGSSSGTRMPNTIDAQIVDYQRKLDKGELDDGGKQGYVTLMRLKAAQIKQTLVGTMKDMGAAQFQEKQTELDKINQDIGKVEASIGKSTPASTSTGKNLESATALPLTLEQTKAAVASAISQKKKEVILNGKKLNVIDGNAAFKALPSGAKFVGPDGIPREKP